jgi:VIT1/CCC1 family predicted Fe2+/Mn2+ transporter
MSIAAGEYVSVGSQADTENAASEIEKSSFRLWSVFEAALA